MTEFDRNCHGPKVYNDKKILRYIICVKLLNNSGRYFLVIGAQFSVYFDILFTDLQKKGEKKHYLPKILRSQTKCAH